ncbi:MAG: histidine phosphatase family protein [Candidatus Sericytochromatia bacterium]|nr:histidine phosphatase family protein [Candidatus Tanganyikabacteria bacterium]
MTLLKWPRRLIVVCRGESVTDVAVRDAEAAGHSFAALQDRPSRVPLSPLGIEQARDAGKRLFAGGHRPDTVFCGPDLASRQAAVHVLRAIGYDAEADLPHVASHVLPLPGRPSPVAELEVAHRLLAKAVDVLHEERLRDLDPGTLAGCTPTGRSRAFAELYRVDPGHMYRRAPGGENHADVALRVNSFLSELGREFAGETIMIVTSRAVRHAIRRLLEPMAGDAAERELAILDDGPPPEEYVCDSSGPVARKFLLQSYYRMADIAQTGARTALSRIRRRGEDDDQEVSYPELPVGVPGDVRGRVLITYLSAGNGHRIAAQAIEADLRERYPDVEVRAPEDLYNFSRPGKLGAQLFYKVIDLRIYHHLYGIADRVPASPEQMNFLRRQVMQLLSRGFKKLLAEFQPDVVVNAHPLGTELLSGAQAGGQVPDSVRNFQVVTDCYGHMFYVLPNVHATFVPNTKVAGELQEKGMPADRIFVTGIPIHPSFAERVDQAVARDRLGLSRTAKVLLVQGNLIDDVLQYDAILEYLVASFPKGVHGLDVEVVVVCGKNAELHKGLQALARGYTGKVRLVPFGMVPSQQMRDIMRAADLSLTKPGGLTTAESIAMELPMVLYEVMGGGQEGYNAEYFKKEGVAQDVYSLEEACRAVADLLDSPERLQAMQSAAARVARPQAASSVADVVGHALHLLGPEGVAWPVRPEKGRARLRMPGLRPTRTRT